jgi:hypothetical protein
MISPDVTRFGAMMMVIGRNVIDLNADGDIVTGVLIKHKKPGNCAQSSRKPAFWQGRRPKLSCRRR